MKRFLIACALVLSALPASAQLTTMPIPLAQWLDNNADPLSAGGFCVFAAGTSTLATTYTTAGGGVANTNPIEFDAAGRPTSGGVFLTPGTSYKFALVDFTGVVTPACTPINGVTIWTVDNIEATPGSASAVDVADATAGESIAAGDAVFLSNGTGGLNAGQWYRTDSDLTYKSTLASMVGVAPNAIGSGAVGSVRISGLVTLAGPLTPGAPYYAAATPGAITLTPPANAIRIGTAQTATTLIVGYTDAPVSPRGPPCGRLTLTTAVPVTVTDVTAATTVFFTPYNGCNQISLYDGTAWSPYAFAQISIAVPATTNTAYDVFAYDNAGVVALELTAWSSLTARATALVLQNGVNVKTGALTRLYLGSFRTTGVSGQTEDSLTKRYLWNYYNRVPRALQVLEATASWTYTTATVRQANGSAANQVEIFVGVAEALLDLELTVAGLNDGGAFISMGIGEDSTTTYASGARKNGVNTEITSARLVKYPAIGSHTYSWNEWSTAAGTTTFYGTNTAGSTVAHGIRGWYPG